MSGETRHSWARWVAIIGVVGLAGCEAVSQRAFNNGPYMIIPCLFLCNTELAIEDIEAEGATGSVTGGAISQTMEESVGDVGETADPPMPIPSPL